jgi:uncharacterized alpha-E superfamily protein
VLSRVASHLYWLSRYLERAENMARILDVGQSLALLSGRSGDKSIAAEPLVLTDTIAAFEKTGKPVTPEHVARFLAWEESLPSSILNCIEASRENARAVRGSITSEMWENINDTWLQLNARRRNGGATIDAQFFDWVKERSHMFRGVSFATIRRDQPYHFIRLGTFIERADNTARILSVKQVASSGSARTAAEAPGGRAQIQSLSASQAQAQSQAQKSAPKAALKASAAPGSQTDSEDQGGDYYRLSAVLRSVSSLEAYRDTYRDAIDARRVAELLIFNPQIPRSLRFCFEEIESILRALPQQTGKSARRLAATIAARLRHGDVEEIYAAGLHQSLEDFLVENTQLGEAVHSAYLELT